jgi:Glycosyltransferase family 87
MIDGGTPMTWRRLRPFVLLALPVLAIVLYITRVRHEMIDFTVWQRSVVRGLHAEALYRVEDGHYVFKYLPAFTLLMAPFGLVDQDTGKLLWFTTSLVLLVTLLRWSVAALPERRLAQSTLVVFAVVLMAKFYAHELLLGQPDLLLGVLLLGALLAVQANLQVLAGGLVGVAAFVKPYALILIPWLLVTQTRLSATTATGVVAIGLLLPATLYGWSGNLDLLRGWLQTVTDSTAPQPSGQRQRVDCRDVGQVAGSRTCCIRSRVAHDRGNDRARNRRVASQARCVSA